MKTSEPASLSSRAASSVLWSGVKVFILSFSKFFTTAILARFIAPDEFGLIGLASLLLTFVSHMGEVGLNAAVIHKKQVDELDLRTTFTLTFGAGVVLCGATVLAAPAAAAFFHNPQVRPVAMLMSLTFVINGFSSTASALLTKHLRFKQTTIIQTLAISAQSAVSLVLVIVFDTGFWGIIIGSLTADFVAMVLRIHLSGWFPRPGFDRARFRELFHYSKNVYGSTIFAYFNSNIDYLVIGRMLDSASLGFYQFAYSIPHLALSRFSRIIVRVAFPVFCQVQDENERFARGYFKTIRWISMAIFPAMAGLFLVSEDFIVVVYGERWLPVVGPLRILCFSGMIRSIFTTNGSVLNAKGRPDLVFKWSMMSFPITLLAVFIGSLHGTEGVAWAMTLSLIPTLIPLRYVIGLIDMRVRTYLSAFIPALIGIMIMVAALAGVRMTGFLDAAPAILRLFTEAGIGAAVYGGFLLLFYRSELVKVLEFVKGARRAN